MAKQRQLASDEVLMSMHTIQDLKDALYVLEAAMEDVDTDLADSHNPKRHHDALWHLYSAAAGLRALRIEPKATGIT